MIEKSFMTPQIGCCLLSRSAQTSGQRTSVSIRSPYSRMLVGWRVDDTMADILIMNAWKQGLNNLQPTPAHSGWVGQNISDDLRKLLDAMVFARA